MKRRWRVTAVYQPLPRTVVRLEWSRQVREVVVPAGVGIEFKFTVAGDVDECGAIEAVKRHGYFCGDIVKQFGFVAVEVFAAAA